MDICTLVFVTSVVCSPPSACEIDVATGNKFCSSVQANACNPVMTKQFDCVKPDGTHYSLPHSAHPSIEK